MVPAPFVVVLDANVLFPFTLRDTLLRAAAAGFYQLRWSATILDEMTRNLVVTDTMTDDRAQRLRAAMERNEFLCNLFDLDPDAFVDVLREQAADLQRPPVTFEEILARLERIAPVFVAAVRARVAG